MKTKVKTKGRRELTLKDRLSRLTYVQACKLLGAEGERLIRRGGGYEIDIDEDLHFGSDSFRLRLDGTVVTITLRWPKRSSTYAGTARRAKGHVSTSGLPSL